MSELRYQTPNHRVDTNRRHARAFNDEREFESDFCVPPLLSAAVGHPGRSPSTNALS